MSTIRLLVIKGGTLYSDECHWRTAIKFMDATEEARNRFLRVVQSKHYLDAGYLLVDCDAGLVINGQQAFALKDCKNKKGILDMIVQEAYRAD
ncbi:MAG TPA: hypothetical protein VJH22_01000 [Candidatus Nanoarchaeia archaeon]|nr:hypothetical protein [Candidatus Nanoarchaeia archaeon]